MRIWDEAAMKHLTSVIASLDDAGLVELVRDCVRVTFRTNLDRHEPDELFDDSSTLGYLSSKNLMGRLMSILRESGTGPLAGVEAFMVSNTIEIVCGNVTVHIIKAPSSPRREPSWSSFNWAERPTRHEAARRNSKNYRAPHAESLIEPLFGLPVVATTGLEACTDIFLIWSGDEATGLTGGWLGLPTAGAESFLAVDRLWWDEIEPPRASSDTSIDPLAPSDGFLSRQPTMPVIGLKRDRATGTDS
jgi:hypothetical protein